MNGLDVVAGEIIRVEGQDLLDPVDIHCRYQAGIVHFYTANTMFRHKALPF